MERNLLSKAKRRLLAFLLFISMIAQSIVCPQGVYANDNVYLEINGYQISTTLEAFRTVYSVVDPARKTEEVGLVYGLTDSVSEADLKVGSTNETVNTYVATPEGKSPVCLSDYENATTYLRTMEFIKTVEFYQSNISIRAYAKLKDGTYAYSDVDVVSVYRIADILYKNSLMNTVSGHNYLYDTVLSVTDSSYQRVNYKYKNILVPADIKSVEDYTTKVSEANTTKPSEENTTPSVTEPATEAPTEPPTEAPTEPPTQGAAFEVIEMPAQDTPRDIELDSYFDGLDVASCSNIGDGNETMNSLFDNNADTKFFTWDEPSRIAWKMKQAVIVKSYTLTTGDDTSQYHRNPANWQLYGSNDATTWIQLDERTKGGGMRDEDKASFTFNTSVQDSYQYFMLQLSERTYVNGSSTGMQLSEISLHGDVAPATEKLGGSLNYFDSIYSPANTINGYNDEGVQNLFDGNTSTKMFNVGTGTIAWKMKSEMSVYSYSLTTANDNATFNGRNPRSWNFYGSTDGNNWVKLDAVTNSGIENKNFTTYTYSVKNVGKYSYFKLDIATLDGDSFQLSEITLNGAAVSPSKYDILLYGDWNLIRSETYVSDLIKLFYNSYPRLYARWGDGSEPTVITYRADKDYDGIAYCQETTVCVSVDYANSHPYDLGFFSHEITHSVQQYGGKLVYNVNSPSGWWTENMANYGGFRYFHWSTPKYVQVYEASDTDLQDWGWQKYGNNKWFFAYMDAKYPTRKNADGSLNYGLIDSINRLIKTNNTGREYDDNPYDTNSEMNRLVKQITGYDCMESLRLRFVQELQSGTWTFKGFADYEDNWRTENIEGVANPEYPMVGEKTHGNITANKLGNPITSGNNLCNGAKIYECAGYNEKSNEEPRYLIDGDVNTKWCGTKDYVRLGEQCLTGAKYFVTIDLGSEKTFNTYTLFNTQSKEPYGNTVEWEILVSNDAKNWRSVDYRAHDDSAIASYDIGSQTARYVMMRIFKPDNDQVGTLRLYEFQLYNR